MFPFMDRTIWKFQNDNDFNVFFEQQNGFKLLSAKRFYVFFSHALDVNRLTSLEVSA